MQSIKSGEGTGCWIRKCGGSHPGLRCALVAFVFGLGAAQACGQCRDEQKLPVTGSIFGDLFGASVGVSGETALVGAWSDDCAAGRNCGSAYVFRFNGATWVEEQKLIAGDATDLDVFGFSVSLSGDTAVVGARGHDCSAGLDCGSAYVFRFDGTSWVEEQRLVASDAEAGDFFGSSVSVSEDTVLVGAFRDSCAAGIECGSAYVFRFDGTSWAEEQKLTASDGSGVDNFGFSVSASGDMALVGAFRARCAADPSHCGAAYVYRFNGSSWVEEQKLIASAGSPADNFGFSVSVSEQTALVGARRDTCAAGIECGSAYVYRFDGISWVEEQKLTASDAARLALFGFSVSVSGETALVGAKFDRCAAGSRCGSAYVFRFNGISWVEEKKLTASDAGAFHEFGTSVSLSGDRALVGAPRGPRGSAYAFSCGPVPKAVGLDIKPATCPNPVTSNSEATLPVAIVGSFDFDVQTVDLDSLSLARADGVGESVVPLVGRGGRGVTIKDVAATADGELCRCPRPRRDGIDDLVLTFSTSELNHVLELEALPRGQSTELVLRGTLQDGTALEARDCVLSPGRELEGRGGACGSGAATVWRSTQPLDQEVDSIEFPTFRQPEKYVMMENGRLDRASLTLDVAGLEELWFGSITELTTVVPLGERTQLYRVDEAFGVSDFVGIGFVTITAFEIQRQGRAITWIFDYEFGLEILQVNALPLLLRLTRISGRQVGSLVTDEGQIEWSAPEGAWDRSGPGGELHLPLSDVVTPGTWSRECGAFRLDGRGLTGDRSTMPVRARVEPDRSTGRKRDRP